MEKDCCYALNMTRVFVANRQPEARSAIRRLLSVLDMQWVGEAADWPTTLILAPATRPDMVVVDGELLTDAGRMILSQLRMACPHTIVIVLLSHLEAREQAALATGADIFISKGETPDRVAEHLRTAAIGIYSGDHTGSIARIHPGE
jgi:DNA-binding NarL/FixJ family response regulator